MTFFSSGFCSEVWGSGRPFGVKSSSWPEGFLLRSRGGWELVLAVRFLCFFFFLLFFLYFLVFLVAVFLYFTPVPPFLPCSFLSSLHLTFFSFSSSFLSPRLPFSSMLFALLLFLSPFLSLFSPCFFSFFSHFPYFHSPHFPASFSHTFSFPSKCKSYQ